MTGLAVASNPKSTPAEFFGGVNEGGNHTATPFAVGAGEPPPGHNLAQ
jgi:hypothetical protein